jgi:signal transduction histidine kinase
MAQIDSSEQREVYVEQILRQFDLMSGMTREVLQFARGETSVLFRKVYMHKFLEEVRTQLNHALAGRGIRLVMDNGYNGVAYFDEQKMLRLIHNISRNAAEAMPGGGEFRITTWASDDELGLEFADQGGGIPPEMEGRVFEAFATAKKGGTGLGLAIVKHVLLRHRARLEIDSRLGQGSTFTCHFPATQVARRDN